ncbi:MAG: UbiA family prenyltransferase [Chitinophagaceae bacterium]|nr:UbiA family prenyltransferase [Chitinophagaceae bacterium]
MPVYWFALSQLVHINWWRAVIIFIILHILVYPASNGYNSYMDRDETPIGGLKNPMQPTKQLFNMTVAMDVIAVTISFFISIYFALGIAFYIMASRAYSYRKIRLKRYPIIGYATVIIFQGAVIYWLVYHGSSEALYMKASVSGMIAASLLIGGFYPLTQIYQHKADATDGVETISYKLGYRGTFVFCASVYSVAMLFLGHTFLSSLMFTQFLIILLFFLPILVYFFWWAAKVWKHTDAADFKNTMRMNILASTCTNLGFITVLILNHLE